METTFTLASRFGVTPFTILDQEIDDVIMVINHYLDMNYYNSNSHSNESHAQNYTKNKNDNQIKRVRVNDQTASGGWF
jgi:hypothetical protein